MSSVIDAKICTCERERDSQEKRLAQLKDIISKLSIIASQSCFIFLPVRVKIDPFNHKTFEKMFIIRRIS